MSPGSVPGLEAHPPFAREFGGTLKLLLTSGGVTNPSIHSALVQLLGKPIAECHALCVPTAQWGHPMCGPTSVRGFVAAEPEWQHLSGLGWASLGVLELTALPTIGAERWVPWIREADVSWSTAATRRTCTTGCGSPGWPICCLRCPTRSGWE